MRAMQPVDWTQVEAELRRLPMPEFVRGLRLKRGEDATGDEAVWVWVRVPEGVTAEPGALEAIEAFRERVREKVWESAPGVWSYMWLEN